MPILAESREDLAILLVLSCPSHPLPSFSSLQLSECPRRCSFVDRSSRFSLEYLTFVSARTDRLCPGVTMYRPSSCDITNILGIQRGGRIDSPPCNYRPLTLTISNCIADIEWLSGYTKLIYFQSELVLLLTRKEKERRRKTERRWR